MEMHLYVIPALAGGAHPDDGERHRVRCLLHVRALPSGYTLDIKIKNDTLKRRDEATAQICSWVQTAGEEVIVRLHLASAEVACWRGIWHGEAMFHVGALAVRVFCNGVEQAEPTYLSPFAAEAETALVNGHDAPTDASLKEASPPPQRAPHSSLDRAQQGDGPVSQREERGAADEAQRRDTVQTARESIRDEEQDEETQWEEQDEENLDETMMVDEEHAEDAGAFPQEEVPHSPAPSSAIEAAASLPAAQVLCGQVTACRMRFSEPEASLQQLTALLAKMPKKTVIVDLQMRSRSQQRKEDYALLSPPQMRDAFGGKYWERGHTITTSYQELPPSPNARIRQWKKAVTSSRPDGIPFLVASLKQGYSLIFLEAYHAYEESTSAAAIEALREQIPALDVRPPTHQ